MNNLVRNEREALKTELSTYIVAANATDISGDFTARTCRIYWCD